MNSKRFLSNAIKYCIPTIISAIVGITVLPLISRIYPESEYGYISNFYSIGNMIYGLAFLGLDQAYIRFFNEPLNGATRNGQGVFAIIAGQIMTFVIFTLVYLSKPKYFSILLFNDEKITGLILLEIYVSFLVLYRICNINYRFSNKPKAYNIQQLCFILGNRLFFIVASLFSSDYIYSVGLMVGCTGLIVIISLLQQKDFFVDARTNSVAIREMLKYALPLMPAGVIVYLNNSIAKLFLGAYNLRAEVGVLAIATSASNIFSIIPSAFTIYWGAFMFKYYRQEQRRIKNVHDIIVILCILLTIGIALFQDLLYLFLGENYRTSQPYFMLIMLSPIATLLLETTAYGISIAKKTNYIFWISAISCIVNAICSCVLIPIIGVYGAVIGIAFSALINFVARTIIGQRYYKSISNWRKTTCGCLLILGLCAGNIVCSENIALRYIVLLIGLLITSFLYRKNIQYLLVLFKRLK